MAEGIPLPPTNTSNHKQFDRNMIVKRAVRIGIFNSETKDYIANAVQVEANWAASAEDKWTFSKEKFSLNPVLFRSTKKDNLDLQTNCFIFEFVIYLRNDTQNIELCCGWAMTDSMTMSERSVSGMKL